MDSRGGKFFSSAPFTDQIAEMIKKMEGRVTALETLLKEDQANREVTHEKAS